MTNNPTLIAGFEDIMVHIRNQEKRIKQLEDELYDLREFKKDAEDTCGSHVIMEVMNTRIENAEKEALKTEQRYVLEKEMNKCHVQKINKLQDALYHRFNIQTCCICEDLYHISEIEVVLDCDYDPLDCCLNCRDNQGYTQCTSCMEYVDNSLVDTDDECSRCNGIRNEDTSSDDD
jgi:hypothetical protein